MTDETLTDIAGNEIRPGDDVVYPQMSGRSVQMVRGKLVEYNGKTAKVERVEGSRWSASYGGEIRYRDKRTGKGIDPTRTLKHYKVKPSHTFTHSETGEVLRKVEGEEASEEYRTVYYQYDRSTWYGGSGFDPRWKPQYHPGVYHDYVEKHTAAPKPSIIHNVKNIVKIEVNDG